LKDADPRVRLLVADAYWLVTGETRTPMPVLLTALKDKDVRLRQHAAEVVSEMGKEAGHAVPQLVEVLKDPDERIAGRLIRVLPQMGRDAAPAIPALVEIVRGGGNSWARGEAAMALMPFGREAKDAVPGLLEMLNGSVHNRDVAVIALPKIATPGEAVPAILKLFAEPSRERDRGEDAIADALHEFGPAVIVPVAGLLQDKRSDVRIRAMKVLASFGKQAQNTVPQLIDSMDDKDDDVALSAAEAVWSIDRRPEVLPHFVRGLKAKTVNNRIRAANNLRNMGADAKPAVPELVAACTDRDSSVRREAYRALALVDNETARKLGDPDAGGK
jgi:HEAT repeat protein